MPVLQNNPKFESSRASDRVYTYDLRNRDFRKKPPIGVFENNQSKIRHSEKSQSTETTVRRVYDLTESRTRDEYRARYYSTELGQFISRDPLEYVDGMNMYSGYFARRFELDALGLAKFTEEDLGHEIENGPSTERGGAKTWSPQFYLYPKITESESKKGQWSISFTGRHHYKIIYNSQQSYDHRNIPLAADDGHSISTEDHEKVHVTLFRLYFSYLNFEINKLEKIHCSHECVKKLESLGYVLSSYFHNQSYQEHQDYDFSQYSEKKYQSSVDTAQKDKQAGEKLIKSLKEDCDLDININWTPFK